MSLWRSQRVFSFYDNEENLSVEQKLKNAVKRHDEKEIKSILSFIDDGNKHLKIVLIINSTIPLSDLLPLFNNPNNDKLELLVTLINSSRSLDNILEDLKEILTLHKMNGEVGYLLCHIFNKIIKDQTKKKNKMPFISPFPWIDDDDEKENKDQVKVNVEDETKVLLAIKPILDSEIIIFREEELNVLQACGANQTLQMLCQNGLNPAKYPNLKAHDNYQLMVELRKSWYQPRKKAIQEATIIDGDVLSIILEY
jgi:hypothetical protein